MEGTARTILRPCLTRSPRGSFIMRAERIMGFYYGTALSIFPIGENNFSNIKEQLFAHDSVSE